MAFIRFNSRFWRISRVIFRRFRLAVWLLILAVICTLLYLDAVGLPGFIKRPVLEKLHNQGMDLQFSRLRLRWYEGIVAENVHFGRADEPQGPSLTALEVRVHLDYRALLKLQLRVDGIDLRQGRLLWPVPEPERPGRVLSLEKIHSRIRFLPNDEWTLDRFEAAFSGMVIRMSGTLQNASAVRDWKFLQSDVPTPAGTWQERMGRLADSLERVHFSGSPDIHLELHGNARDLQSFNLRLILAAPGAETPWGKVQNGRLGMRLFAAETNGQSRASVSLDAMEAQTPWAATTNLHVEMELSSLMEEAPTVRGTVLVEAGQAVTRWASGSAVRASAQWVHSLTNPIPLVGKGQVEAQTVRTPWGKVGKAHLAGRFSTPQFPGGAAGPEAWGWWQNLRPYEVDWEARLSGLSTPWLEAEELSGGGGWHGPVLVVTNLQARLCGGQVALHARLDVLTRRLNAEWNSDFDWHPLLAPLSAEASRALSAVSWPVPPRVQAQVALTLPAWTNRQPDWRAEVLPGLSLHSEWTLPEGGSWSGVSVAWLHTHLDCTNEVVSLPDLTLMRPDGRLELSPWWDSRSQRFGCHLFSSVPPQLARPFLSPEAREAFDLAVFNEPPVIEAEAGGRLNDLSSLTFRGRVAVTNFSFRGQSFSSVQTGVQYSNQVVEFLSPRVRRGAQVYTADGLAADFHKQVVYLTNGYSTGEPMVVARAIGEHVARAIKPFEFLTPPTAHVYGVIPMYGDELADLHFDLDGGPFHWWHFTVPHIRGHVHWRGKRVNLTDMDMDFYGGHAEGGAAFDFSPAEGGDFQFHVAATNVVLQFLMADLSERTNHLEGQFDATLIVTHGNTLDKRFTDGYGQMSLRDGLLWDIPMFGVVTPMLDSLSSGLGHARVGNGACTFTMTNGVLFSQDMELRASAFRLLYRGTVDLDENVNARVEAQPLHDMRVVGPVVSTAFWPMSKLFEYRVTGTLDEPKTVPVYILPRMMLLPFQMPFHPVRTLKNLFPPENEGKGTNAPALEEPPVAPSP